MIQLPFLDRAEAGRLLAAELLRHRLPANVMVLAFPRGGVPVGFEVARVLRAPLDVVVVRKLGVSWQPELAMGATAGGCSAFCARPRANQDDDRGACRLQGGL
jgi:putative phosphoribosyl transferase